MRADKMVGLTSSAFSTYEESYAAIQELRDIFNKQVALDAKIEKVEVTQAVANCFTERN
jgi:ubiquinone biosynthesis protein Coq4